MSSSPEQTDASQSLPEAAKDGRPALWLEVFVVLVLAVLPHLFHAISSFWLPRNRPPFTYTALADLMYAIQESVPVLFIMRLSGKPWSYFGVTRPRILLDFGLAAVVFVSVVILMLGAALILPSDRPKGREAFLGEPGERDLFFILVACFSIGFAEELVMRGYLIPRFEELLGSSWESVLVSSTIFASYHIYAGVFGTVKVFLMGLIAGAAFCVARRLWPLILMHATWDAIAYLLRV
jgi:membrane protease YdiL (CAAX protease family)